MIIVCPNCAATFQVEAQALGAQGRTVRCTRCRTMWFETPPEDVFPQADVRSAEPAEMIADDEDADADVLMTETVDLDRDLETEAPADERGPTLDAVTVAPPPLDDPKPARGSIAALRAAERRQERKTRQKRSFAAYRGLALPSTPVLALAVLSLCLLAAVVWREGLVRTLPATALVYDAVGLGVNLRGLAFEDVTASEHVDDGVPMLHVSGNIVNVTGKIAAVPRLRLAVVNSAGREVFVWTAVPQETLVQQDAVLPFRAQLASPPAEGRSVTVRFLSGRDISAAAHAGVTP